MKYLNQSLRHKWSIEIESAYVITLKDNEISERMSARCMRSCEKLGMPVQRWETFDGLKGDIKIPDHLTDRTWLRWIKVVNPALGKSEIALVLAHATLWAHCCEIDKPIVILEHDAVCVQKITHHPAINAICYLGSIEQVQNKFQFGPIPIMGQMNENYRFILRTHAYSVDPLMAKRLLTDLLQHGISTSIDVLIRSDIYAQVQFGVYAFDMAEGLSTGWDKEDKKKNEGLMRIHNKLAYH
jgi:GR25 family glycosyltransferase involved in LPS biosynthesis